MIKRYENPRVASIWSDNSKFLEWQAVELFYLEAQGKLDRIDWEIFCEIEKRLKDVPIDCDKIYEIEERTKHDLNAFVQERQSHLPENLQRYFHAGNTSYDTEEPAMAIMLKKSAQLTMAELTDLCHALRAQADCYRYSVMNGRTHGQEAELMSFGSRLLGFVQDLNIDGRYLTEAVAYLNYSKFSGAIGKYGTIDPELEEMTLTLLGLKPYIGATQIVPRELYNPLANALAQLMQTLQKLALNIRLSGRSGRPFCHEPFGKGQMGSSAMPHKKNNIVAEQIEGMARLARGYANMIQENIPTWEERAIEQSSVERVAWPDLFHVTIHSLRRLTSLIKGLVVYPENMLLEVKESGGLYASNEAKELLKELGEPFGLGAKEAYEIVQLAAFNVFEAKRLQIKYSAPTTLEQADQSLATIELPRFENIPDFKDIIESGGLRVSPQLAADQQTVASWNNILYQIFSEISEEVDHKTATDRWQEIFRPSHCLRHESHLYDSIKVDLPTF